LLFTKDYINIVDGIYDFIDKTDDYIDNYEEISKDWAQSHVDNKSFVSLETQAIFNCCDLLVQNYRPENVLDIGCGFGYVINNLKCKNKFGVDISLNQLKYVDYNVTKIRCYAKDIPLNNEYFDMIICTDLFEHVLEPYMLVLEIDRLLKKDGILLFACPWQQDLSVYESEEYKENFKNYKYLHLRSVNESDIKYFKFHFTEVASTMITVAMKDMMFEPYPIKFIQFIK